MKRPTRQTQARGFTLIEVIVALTLMSLIMLGLISAFATLGKTATRLDEHAGKSSREWLVGEFLRATLSSANGQIRQRLSDESEALYFQGGPERLQWLGSMPARHGAGGLYFFHMAPEPAGKRTHLILRYTPYIPDTTPNIAGIDSHPLAENISRLNILYQSHPTRVDEEAVWSEVWNDPDRLPARVRIDIVVSDGPAWPPMIIALGSIDASGGGSGSAGRHP
jgi:general secretion pathway protein J